MNAEDHVDSDLAVDGLTLLDAVHGQWRWHYPGTPYMGITPMLFSYPQARVWGTNATTLVSGGYSHLGAGRGFDLLAGVAGVRAGGRRLGDRAAGILVAGDDLAVGTDHGGTLVDLGLAQRGVRGPARLSDARRLGVRGRVGALVRPGTLSRRHVPVHSGGIGAGGDSHLVPVRTVEGGDQPGRGVPDRDDGRPSASGNRPPGRSP